jgi:Zn-dependent peptidase ImmA (M78 family)
VASTIGSDNPTAIAADLRWKLGIGDIEPIFHLPAIISDKLKVFVFTLENTPIRGACTRVDGVSFIFLPSASDTDRLYSCARQLGYLLSATAMSSDVIFSLFEPKTNNIKSPVGLYEQFADSFALELLIPTRGLGIALKEVRKLIRVSSGPIGDIELLYVARIFGVGFFELARRCERADLLPRGGACALYQFLVEKFGGPEARANSLQLPPRPLESILPIPSSILHAIVNRIRNGSISIEEAAVKLRCSPSFLNQTLHNRKNSH